mgnify:CR=1 FL=1
MAEALSRPLPLAVVILTLNEARFLPECLASVAGLGERVLVVDSGSSDGTVEIARQLGAEVVYRAFTGFAEQRNAALALVTQPWVLFLDADERLTRPLQQEIRRAIATAADDVAGFAIPRRNRVLGRELRGGGWWPDYQVRLLRVGRARYTPGREVHETVDVDGDVVRLREPLLHLNYDSWAEFRDKQRRYARMGAAIIQRDGPLPRRRAYVGRPAREAWRRFVGLSGYRDGVLGFKLALSLAWYEFRMVGWARSRTTAKDEPPGSPRDDQPLSWAAPRVRVRRRQPIPARNPSPAVEPAARSPLTLPPLACDLSIVIVSYNVRELLLACLASIEASLADHRLVAEVIVVDNNSADASADAVRRRFPQVRVIESGANNGFAVATNQGIRASRGRVIALLNPDTYVVGDALGILARYLEEHPDVGVAGPRLSFPDGSTQSSRRRFPTRLTGFVESTIVQDYWHNNPVVRRYYIADRPDDVVQDVDWLVGACLVTRRDVVTRVGLFDERFFMYSEEVEWCRRVHEAGLRVVYLPDATVIHHAGSSVQDSSSRQITFDTSKVLLYEVLYGPATARILRAYLLATYLLRIAIESGKGALGHKVALRRERVGLYARAFRSRLRGRQRTP